MNIDFEFSTYNAFYKGKPLPFDQPIKEWIKLFGDNYRKFPGGEAYYQQFIWDDLGIAVEEEGHNSKDEKRTKVLYIFYSNLETPAGQKGKLKSGGYNDYSRAIDEYKKQTKKSIEDILKIVSYNQEKGYKNINILNEFFIYPYTTYKKSVIIDGSEVGLGMSLKEVNKNRNSLDLQKFTFRDDNMNMINERGTIKGDNGEYWNDYLKLDKNMKQDYYFLNSIYYSDYELEFIKVGYRKLDDKEPYF